MARPKKVVLQLKPEVEVENEIEASEPVVLVEPLGREPVPRVNAERFTGKSTRFELLKELNEQNPAYVHMYADPRVLTEDVWKAKMDRKGQELVRLPNGKILTHAIDPVVRVARESYEEDRLEEAEASRKMTDEAVKREESTVYSKPKTAK